MRRNVQYASKEIDLHDGFLLAIDTGQAAADCVEPGGTSHVLIPVFHGAKHTDLQEALSGPK